MSKEIKVKKDFEFKNDERYQALLGDCQSIAIELEYERRKLQIEKYWELGKRIYDENENMKRDKVYGKKVIQTLSNDLGINSAVLHDAVKFYKQFALNDFNEVIMQLPGGKETSWNKIRQKVLGSRGEEKTKEDEEGGEEVKKDDEVEGDESVYAYKIEQIADALRVLLYEDVGVINSDEIEEYIKSFRRILSGYKR